MEYAHANERVERRAEVHKEKQNVQNACCKREDIFCLHEECIFNLKYNATCQYEKCQFLT